jgi:hypothetical protein
MLPRHGSRHPRWSKGVGLLSAGTVGALVAVLAAGGAATSAQSPPTTETTTTAPPAPVEHTVSTTAKLKIKYRYGAYVGTGPCYGKPFGKGKFRSRLVLVSSKPLRIKGSLTATYKAGTIVFKGKGTYVGSTFKATFDVSRGTGAYAKAKGKKLRVTSRAHNGVDTMKLKGKISYPES